MMPFGERRKSFVSKSTRISNDAYKEIAFIRKTAGVSSEKIIDLALRNFKNSKDYAALMLFGGK